MLSFNEAQERVLNSIKSLPSRRVGLEEAAGLILAEDVVAPIDLPPFDNSMMDGYAVHSAEVRKCVSVEVSEVIRAGDQPKALKEGTCVKIMTGAVIPAGADSVVPIEDVATDDGTVTFMKPVTGGQFVRYKGEDVKKGSRVVLKGTCITARHIGLLAALGFERVNVHPRPRVGILVTGSEIIENAGAISPGKIYDSNGPTLSSMLRELGINAKVVHASDDEKHITKNIKDLLSENDILLTVGGVSVGEYDHVKSALEKLGVKQEFWRVKMKPGKPLVFGTFKDKYVFGLPGNPVSCFVTFDQFVRPSILKMMGRDLLFRIRRTAILEDDLEGSERFDLLRGICEEKEGELVVRSAGGQNSAMLLSLAAANCLIMIPEEKRLVKKGETVEIEFL